MSSATVKKEGVGVQLQTIAFSDGIQAEAFIALTLCLRYKQLQPEAWARATTTRTAGDQQQTSAEAQRQNTSGFCHNSMPAAHL